jgi:Dolichyl-phosphate-mannose-protein mannosyltransferase
MWRPTLLALCLVLGCAAVPRYLGIRSGLEHAAPMVDERDNFVEPIRRMQIERSWNPSVYSGYPGFFNWLLYFPVTRGLAVAGDSGGYIAGRLVTATASTLNVALIFWLLLRLTSSHLVAVYGGLLLAASRAEIATTRIINADVLIVTALLLLLLLGESQIRRRNLLGAAILGLAVATKYSGLLLVPALLLVANVRSARKGATLLLIALVVFVAAAPFAVLGAPSGTEQGAGFLDAVHFYFGGSLAATWQRALNTGGLTRIVLNLGWLALAFVPAALFGARRTVIAAGVTAAVSGSVLLFTIQVWPRHTLLPSAALTILAAVGIGRIAALSAKAGHARWGPALTCLLAAASLVGPIGDGVRRTRGAFEAQPRERVATALSQRQARRVLSTVVPFKAPGIEVRLSVETHLPREYLAQFDALVTTAEDLPRLDMVSGAPVSVDGGLPLLLLQPPPPSERLRLLTPEELLASDGSPAYAFDGDRKTVWSSTQSRSWLEARWLRPVDVRLLEIQTPANSWPQELVVLGAPAEPGTAPWRPLAVLPVRPERRERQRPPHGQVFFLREPTPLAGLRVVRRSGGPWSVETVHILGP